MAVDEIQSLLPGADVKWERTPRVRPEKLTVSVKGGLLVSVPQKDISDHYRGKGADDLRHAIEKYKDEHCQRYFED
jgi:hypothetical protein